MSDCGTVWPVSDRSARWCRARELLFTAAKEGRVRIIQPGHACLLAGRELAAKELTRSTSMSSSVRSRSGSVKRFRARVEYSFQGREAVAAALPWLADGVSVLVDCERHFGEVERRMLLIHSNSFAIALPRRRRGVGGRVFAAGVAEPSESSLGFGEPALYA